MSKKRRRCPRAEYNTRRGRGHETVDEEIFADALRRPEIEAMRAWAKNLRRRSHEAKTLLGTSPEQRNRSIPSGIRAPEASGCLRFPPLWETSVWRVMRDVWCVMCDDVCWVVCDVCGVVLCGCAVWLCCVVCGVLWCSVPSVRTGGVLFKTRAQYQRVLGITLAEVPTTVLG